MAEGDDARWRSSELRPWRAWVSSVRASTAYEEDEARERKSEGARVWAGRGELKARWSSSEVRGGINNLHCVTLA
jgi:hypothetical protein